MQLNKHKRQECIERRCPCSDCGALFPSPARLRNHRIAVHREHPVAVDDINTYQCCKCNQGFQTEEELLKHQEKFASNLNCDIKPQGKKRGRKPKHTAHSAAVDSKRIKKEEEAEGCKGYSDSTMERFLSKEQEMELKIPCPEAECDLLFPSVSALRAHKREDHGSLPHKTHMCTECDESYAWPEQLSVHMAKVHHSGHTCSTCGKIFAQENILMTHQRTHAEGEELAEQ